MWRPEELVDLAKEMLSGESWRGAVFLPIQTPTLGQVRGFSVELLEAYPVLEYTAAGVWFTPRQRLVTAALEVRALRGQRQEQGALSAFSEQRWSLEGNWACVEFKASAQGVSLCQSGNLEAGILPKGSQKQESVLYWNNVVGAPQVGNSPPKGTKEQGILVFRYLAPTERSDPRFISVKQDFSPPALPFLFSPIPILSREVGKEVFKTKNLKSPTHLHCLPVYIASF